MELIPSQAAALAAIEKALNIELTEIKNTHKNGYEQKKGMIVELVINGVEMEVLPKELEQLSRLEKFSASKNFLESIGVLQNLDQLMSLNLSDNKLSDISVLQNLVNLDFLVLETNQISDLEPLAHLNKLTVLRISKNFIHDLSPLRNLKMLNALEASENRITELPELAGLQKLEILELATNKIKNIEPLSVLRGLRFLNLYHNALSDISSVRYLDQLVALDLVINDIVDLTGLENCNMMETLGISYNQITDLRALANMKKLKTLNMTGLVIPDLSPLVGLNSLIELGLRDTSILDTASLSRCTGLQKLYISGTKLSDLHFLSSLVNLRTLLLGSTGISDVNAIKNLSKLEYLDISGNQISIFPAWLSESAMEITRDIYSGYRIDNNPIENVPSIFLRQNNSAILDYLKSLEGGSRAINEIKVIILGEGAAGKTSFVKYLKGEGFDPNQSQTHGINIAECMQDLGITMKIWDFGGQDIMHHTHQLFLTQNSVYILLLNAREKTDTEKWLKMIKVFGGDSPVMIVTNKIDEHPSDRENIRFLDTKYDNLKGRYARISCKTGEGLDDVQKLLKNTISGILHARTLWSNSWLAVKEELEDMRKGRLLKDYIHYDMYEQLCNKHGVFENHRDTLIGWLNELGVVTYFADAQLNETNVINPSWLTEAFYAIINSKTVAGTFGRFSLSDLGQILDPVKYPHRKYAFLMALMTKFELCYVFDKGNYLIPDLLKKEEPYINMNMRMPLNFKFKYSTLLPKAVLPKFMVRRHLEISDSLMWRSGLVMGDLSYGAAALVRLDEEEKEITVSVSGEDKKGYLASIRSTFNNINSLYEGLEFEELVPCYCKLCVKSTRPFYFKYSLLKRLKDKSENFCMCENSLQRMQVNELLGVMLSREDLEKEVKKIIGAGSFSIKKSLEEGDIKKFISNVKQLFSSVSYFLFEKNEKSYHVPLLMVLRSIFGNQVKGDEVQATGRADIILNLDDYVYILELKLDGSAEVAMEQIHLKKYYTPYEIEEKHIELIGINFSSEVRNATDYRYERLPRTVDEIGF
ncbi:leucine-rich repeat domain-containing protein [Pedobacter polysacchareus]|uniref:leucine-rich repeat domain-containing protein n=1 Tax=Pedobacter polysacchareus TaxID=2861973 RepID=UPI001C991AD8|nr:COR domain-containing protein [Pedobacter polysacchareus]